MTGLLPLGFASPWMLLGLGLLPVIWWLLRLTPPRPREFAFPPLRLLLGLKRPEETPERSPWWLTLLRLALAALVILALAGPVWRPDAGWAGHGPLLVVLDNGWAAAADWEARRAAVSRVLDAAAASDRPVILAVSAPVESEQDLTPKSAGEAQRRLLGLEPQPYEADRPALAASLEKAAREAGVTETLWFADGIDLVRPERPRDGRPFAEALARISGLAVYAEGARTALGLKSARNVADALEAVVAGTGAPAQGLARAVDGRGRAVGEAPFRLGPGARESEVRFTLPVELRNEVVRVELAGEATAGAVQLLDERSRRRRVGLISGEGAEQAQPLLSPLHYIGRALAPYAELRDAPRGDLARGVKDLIEARSSVIVLADVGTVVGDAGDRLGKWVEDGGTLLRFAGPRLAAGSDELTPVRLRRGGRVLGGALSWEQPQPLGALDGPFAGIAVPKDVEVNRQVLAEPDPGLSDRTWAALADGTPLVTAAERGKGRIILFHVTADTRWSNLPLSGAFVEMLRRIAALAPAAGGAAQTGAGTAAGEAAPHAAVPLPPWRVLDGRGRLGAPAATVRPVPESEIDALRPARERPPGFYGTEDGFRALNLLRASDALAPLDVAGLPNTAIRTYAAQGAVDLRPWALGLAVLLLALDSLAVLALSGALRFGAAAGALAFLVLLPAPPGEAQPAPQTRAPSASRAEAAADDFALKASLQTHLAYVITGNAEIDSASRAGLVGLSRFLAERTAFEPAEPMGVDIGRDDLAFFPLLYWPIDPSAPEPAAAALQRIDAFMKNGGTILFDTRDELLAPPGGGAGPGTLALRRILSNLDLPPLEPAPGDHVVTKAFYLLQDFPGRYQGGALWVEAMPEAKSQEERPARAGDGVSPILITSNDLAGAWAVDEAGAPLYPTVPAEPRQRELAYRAGVNIVMYALTGNYKADQVHVPALLERLGQ